MKKRNARITAIASYLPVKILTNKDFEIMVDTSDEWITQRTGIKERHIAASEESTSDMGVKAAESLIKKYDVDPSCIDFVIVATMTPDVLSSSTAAIIQDRIGAVKAAAMDVQAACSGFLYALSIAKAYIESGVYEKILIIASEKISSITDYTDRGTSILFGDAAAAILIDSEGEGYEIEHICLGSDGSKSDLITIPAGGTRMPATLETVKNGSHYLRLEGKEVFKHAVKRMARACVDCLEFLKVSHKEVSWLIPHQANMRIIDALAKKLDFPDEKIIKTISKYGNTSASSLPLAFEELILNHSVSKGELVLLVAFGAGLTWGAGMLKKING